MLERALIIGKAIIRTIEEVKVEDPEVEALLKVCTTILEPKPLRAATSAPNPHRGTIYQPLNSEDEGPDSSKTSQSGSTAPQLQSHSSPLV